MTNIYLPLSRAGTGLFMIFKNLQYARARNNFRIVSSHDDRPNSFLLGHVSFLAGQMYMMDYSFRGP